MIFCGLKLLSWFPLHGSLAGINSRSNTWMARAYKDHNGIKSRLLRAPPRWWHSRDGMKLPGRQGYKRPTEMGAEALTACMYHVNCKVMTLTGNPNHALAAHRVCRSQCSPISKNIQSNPIMAMHLHPSWSILISNGKVGGWLETAREKLKAPGRPLPKP